MHIFFLLSAAVTGGEGIAEMGAQRGLLFPGEPLLF
jgi:hypothetical protein